MRYILYIPYGAVPQLTLCPVNNGQSQRRQLPDPWLFGTEHPFSAILEFALLARIQTPRQKLPFAT